ncbi:hypothetical protein FOA52_009414 [Chlamydomonas sp. UWO 241]|nr:hypothetical protein FOA52_009414 [Chlamydomonas sp. UWO 241]
MGVLLFLLTTSKYPFELPQDIKSAQDVFKNIKNGRMRPFPDEMSAGCRACILGMLRLDPKKRTTLKELKANPWLAAQARMHAVSIGRLENVMFRALPGPPQLREPPPAPVDRDRPASPPRRMCGCLPPRSKGHIEHAGTC